ncbi:MAG: hypothetical protein GEV09_17710 [Pseudonocardiaceae bacterium]|nr:hypothetical protein [Pseudonocardiaceae bacterium]
MANPRPPADPEPTRWTIHGERLVDDSRKMDQSIAQVELPSGVHFEQYALRMPQARELVSKTPAASRGCGARPVAWARSVRRPERAISLRRAA